MSSDRAADIAYGVGSTILLFAVLYLFYKFISGNKNKKSENPEEDDNMSKDEEEDEDRDYTGEQVAIIKKMSEDIAAKHVLLANYIDSRIDECENDESWDNEFMEWVADIYTKVMTGG